MKWLAPFQLHSRVTFSWYLPGYLLFLLQRFQIETFNNKNFYIKIFPSFFFVVAHSSMHRSVSSWPWKPNVIVTGVVASNVLNEIVELFILKLKLAGNFWFNLECHNLLLKSTLDTPQGSVSLVYSRNRPLIQHSSFMKIKYLLGIVSYLKIRKILL